MPRKNRWEEQYGEDIYTVPDPNDERQQAIKDAQEGNNYVAPEPTPAPKPERDQNDTRGEEVAAAREGNNYPAPAPTPPTPPAPTATPSTGSGNRQTDTRKEEIDAALAGLPSLPGFARKSRHPELMDGGDGGAPRYSPPLQGPQPKGTGTKPWENGGTVPPSLRPPTTVTTPKQNTTVTDPFDGGYLKTGNNVLLVGDTVPTYKPPKAWGDYWDAQAAQEDLGGQVSPSQVDIDIAKAAVQAATTKAKAAGKILTADARQAIVDGIFNSSEAKKKEIATELGVPIAPTGGKDTGGGGGEDVNTLANKFAGGQITQEEMSRLALQFGVNPKAVLDKVSQIRTGARNEGGGGGRTIYQAPGAGAPGTTTPGTPGLKNFTEVPMPDGYESLLDRVMSAAGYTKTGSRNYTGMDVPITSALVYGLVNDPAQVAWLRNFFMQQKMWKEV